MAKTKTVKKSVTKVKVLPYVALQSLAAGAVLAAYAAFLNGTSFSSGWGLAIVAIQGIILYGIMLLLASLADRKSGPWPLYGLLVAQVFIVLNSAPALLTVQYGLFPLVLGVPAIVAAVVGVVIIKQLRYHGTH